ncbi:MAG: hypothetical protein ABI702_04020 [Burkholderiales bacterium]
MPASPPPPTRYLWRTLPRAAPLVSAIVLVFSIAQNWNRWSGNADHQRTDDAFLS